MRLAQKMVKYMQRVQLHGDLIFYFEVLALIASTLHHNSSEVLSQQTANLSSVSTIRSVICSLVSYAKKIGLRGIMEHSLLSSFLKFRIKLGQSPSILDLVVVSKYNTTLVSAGLLARLLAAYTSLDRAFLCLKEFTTFAEGRTSA